MIAIIAEKPSVGMDIARVVGADSKNDGYCAGGGYMVTWALGHLVSLALPDAYGYTKTAAEDLPMLPEPFRLVSRQVRHGARPCRLETVENHRKRVQPVRQHHRGHRCRTRLSKVKDYPK